MYYLIYHNKYKRQSKDHSRIYQSYVAHTKLNYEKTALILIGVLFWQLGIAQTETENKNIPEVEEITKTLPNHPFEPFKIDRPDGFFRVIETAASFNDFIIEPMPTVSFNDLDTVIALSDSNITPLNYSLELVFNKKGAEDLRAFTSRSKGAFTALIIDRKVVMMPFINSEFDSGKLVVSGIKNEAEQKKLLKAVQKHLD